ncbi:hypothetical protein AVEN_87423-1 [Araneus ventricosus]|uniref:Uncharacterized protein n=1 Tax=Araneus ventricosus TaxID=182803 RepID=A0A4Y2UFB9_ARAVE|nr:hypothetical protein AVEN_208062-1 [Araneus ventricosus]GBO10310.1 hypothetical protein AVEN_87423-1 [Araneus ventricosus]
MVKKIHKCESEFNERLFDFEPKPVGLDECKYIAKIKELDSHFTFLQGELATKNEDFNTEKNEIKDSTNKLLETAQEIKSVAEETKLSYDAL